MISGLLVLDGLMQEITLGQVLRLPMSTNEFSYLDLKLANTYLGFNNGTFSTKTDGARLFCFQISVFDEETLHGRVRLILTTEDGDRFHRIGYFEFYKTELEDLDVL